MEAERIMETSEREKRLPLSLLWKATLWLEGRYRQEARPALPLLIAQHYGLMAAHPEAREDPHLVELLMGHFRHWEGLGRSEQIESEVFMKNGSGHQTVTLAKSEFGVIERCRCNGYHVSLRNLMLHFNPEEFAALLHLFRTAEEREAGVVHLRPGGPRP